MGGNDGLAPYAAEILKGKMQTAKIISKDYEERSPRCDWTDANFISRGPALNRSVARKWRYGSRAAAVFGALGSGTSVRAVIERTVY